MYYVVFTKFFRLKYRKIEIVLVDAAVSVVFYIFKFYKVVR